MEYLFFSDAQHLNRLTEKRFVTYIHTDKFNVANYSCFVYQFCLFEISETCPVTATRIDVSVSSLLSLF